jgi:hypothetical protein
MKTVDAQNVFGASVRMSRNLPGMSQPTLAERAKRHAHNKEAGYAF